MPHFLEVERESREIILYAGETVLGSFGFDRAVYGNFKKKTKKEERNRFF